MSDFVLLSKEGRMTVQKSPKIPKVSIHVRLPMSLVERFREIGESISVDTDSTLYRWALEAFVADVDSAEDPPPLSSVTQLARMVKNSETLSRKKAG